MAKHPKPVHQMTEASLRTRFHLAMTKMPESLPEGPPMAVRAFAARVAAIRRSMTCRPANGTGNARNARRRSRLSLFGHRRNDL